ncbi:hypothetical protein B0A52_08678 [Exophiala mesophila]|uniref:Uncharacterized protein n=1 Tax=Exophiala mesophila TaxID=212818 RepID=A0A438MZ08_EXOME|nr:hypothetical protein B0A52_08678 [Exophiala mesophila]
MIVFLDLFGPFCGLSVPTRPTTASGIVAPSHPAIFTVVLIFTRFFDSFFPPPPPPPPPPLLASPRPPLSPQIHPLHLVTSTQSITRSDPLPF